MKKRKQAVKNTKSRPVVKYELWMSNTPNNVTDVLQDRNPFVLVLIDGDGYLVRPIRLELSTVN